MVVSCCWCSFARGRCHFWQRCVPWAAASRGPVNPKLPPLPVFVLKSCINEFFLDCTSLTARCPLKCSFAQHYSVWLRMIIENINIRSLAVSMWSWVFLVTYQQTSGRCQPLMCVTPAARGRTLVVNGSDGTLKSCEAKLLLGKRVRVL